VPEQPAWAERPWEADTAEAGNKAADEHGVRRTLGCAGVIFLVAIVAILLVVASRESGTGQSAATSDAGDRYAQTWTQDYASTTCSQWAGDMTEQQRFAAAADMLTSARNKRDGGTGLPPDSLIRTFQGGITSGCQPIASAKITDIAVFLYLTARTRFAP
jgi:hypothetical protein